MRRPVSRDGGGAGQRLGRLRAMSVEAAQDIQFYQREQNLRLNEALHDIKERRTVTPGNPPAERQPTGKALKSRIGEQPREEPRARAARGGGCVLYRHEAQTELRARAAGTLGMICCACLRTICASAASPGQDGIEAMAPARISPNRAIAPSTPSSATALGRPCRSSCPTGLPRLASSSRASRRSSAT